MRDSREYSPGSGMNGHAGVAEAVIIERRLTRLEAGHEDHSRRLLAMELSHHEMAETDHLRDRSSDKMDSKLDGLMTSFEGLMARFARLEADNKRFIVGGLMGSLGLIYQVLKPKLGL